MTKLPDSLHAWPSGQFAQVLKSEIQQLRPGCLPLDHAASSGGRVDDENLTATVLRVADDGAFIRADVGVFFDEIVAGCSCGDDPQIRSAYCELRMRIDKATADAIFLPRPTDAEASE